MQNQGHETVSDQGLPNQSGAVERLEKDKQSSDGEDKAESSGEKNLQVVCFNCGVVGHMSSTCKNPKVCFICQHTDHVVENCPKWLKPPVAGQYYGSANKGLGFFLIDVEARENRFKHWQGLDNFGLVSIVSGEISEEGLVTNLRELFDRNWDWQLKKTEDRASLFNLNKAGVVASLSVWNGNIEPIGRLQEVWV